MDLERPGGLKSRLVDEVVAISTSSLLLSLGTNLVVLVGLKVGQRGVAGGGEGHDFDPAVNQALVVQFLEHPPKQGDGTAELQTRAGKLHIKVRNCWIGLLGH